ncbi:protein-disulfide reductase DsbD domain-containing protein [Celeribacter litoreus]|uniref:protein-disulfide reductase DsbD domain-containing protein n=1 Tax=Celeribacter litoreus TaxID=2876714 RepID=UPI001CCF534C|nr:protein-disulfide reductase DsbD domain-containing protein [Celeribacter litoreus]MCA0044310.1 hypothetical protein [Celeribacter litoreus]
MNKVASLLSACLLAANPALGQDVSDMAHVEILTGWQMENGNRMAAIRISLEPGWHTYYRAPGESGIPPQIDLTGSNNIASMRLHWPSPELHVSNGMWYLGYEDELLLPIELSPLGGGDFRLNGVMEFGVCDDVCVPMSVQLGADFNASQTPSYTQEIRAALADQPALIENATCDAVPLQDGMRLTASLKVPELSGDEVAVVEHPDKSIWVSQAMLSRAGGTLEIESDLVPPSAQPFMLERSALTITVVGGGKAYQANGCKGS